MDRLPRWIAPVALGFALLSLGLNVYLLRQLQRPERWVVPLLGDLAGRLVREDTRLRYEVRVPAGTPIQLNVPVDERVPIQVDTVIPINTRVRVPVRGPLGTANVSVPIRARVPLRTTLPLRIRHTFRLRTRTNSEIVVPLEFRVRDLPLDELIIQSVNPSEP